MHMLQFFMKSWNRPPDELGKMWDTFGILFKVLWSDYGFGFWCIIILEITIVRVINVIQLLSKPKNKGAKTKTKLQIQAKFEEHDNMTLFKEVTMLLMPWNKR